MRKGAIIAGYIALGIVAVAGWARRPAAPPSMNFNPLPAYANSYNPAQTGYGAQPATHFTPVEPYADRQYVRVVRQPQTVVEREVVRQPVVERRVVREAPVRAQNKRSTAKSAAIVAGSAGAGAAVGALAGGGKGAAIGAISGGAAGFIYDRLTHKR